MEKDVLSDGSRQEIRSSVCSRKLISRAERTCSGWLSTSDNRIALSIQWLRESCDNKTTSLVVNCSNLYADSVTSVIEKYMK